MEYQALTQMPEAIAATLALMDPVRALAREIAQSKAVLYLGRHVGYPVALEGALKLKEIAYMHAEGFAAGELKHGSIALIEDGVPVVVTVPSLKSQPILHAKMVSNIREIQARGARTIIIAEEFDDTVAPFADYLSSFRGYRPCSSRWWRPFRCRSLPPRSPPPVDTTSTSRETWPSPSPWSDARVPATLGELRGYFV